MSRKPVGLNGEKAKKAVEGEGEEEEEEAATAAAAEEVENIKC